jgi:hypothetical protein
VTKRRFPRPYSWNRTYSQVDDFQSSEPRKLRRSTGVLPGSTHENPASWIHQDTIHMHGIRQQGSRTSLLHHENGSSKPVSVKASNPLRMASYSDLKDQPTASAAQNRNQSSYGGGIGFGGVHGRDTQDMYQLYSQLADLLSFTDQHRLIVWAATMSYVAPIRIRILLPTSYQKQRRIRMRTTTPVCHSGSIMRDMKRGRIYTTIT